MLCFCKPLENAFSVFYVIVEFQTNKKIPIIELVGSGFKYVSNRLCQSWSNTVVSTVQEKVVHARVYIKFQYIYPAVTINGQDRRGLPGTDYCGQAEGYCYTNSLVDDVPQNQSASEWYLMSNSSWNFIHSKLCVSFLILPVLCDGAPGRPAPTPATGIWYSPHGRVGEPCGSEAQIPSNGEV